MANSEKTLVLVKPDGVSEGHIGEVITRLERKGYQIAALKVIKATAEQLQQHYSEKVGKPYFKEIETYMMSTRRHYRKWYWRRQSGASFSW